MVLVVDDDPVFLADVDRTLREAGYRVLTTEAPRRALGLALTLKGELSAAIIDLDLPETGGFELIHRLQSEAPELKVIAVSGVFQEHILEIARYMGAKVVLRKPIQSERLVETIRRFQELAG